MKTGIIMVLTGMAMLVAGVLTAKADDVTAYGLNIKDLVSNTRAGIALPLDGGATLTTVYTPLLGLHDSDNVEYASFDIGAAAKKSTLSDGKLMCALGIRPENILAKLLTKKAWVKNHVSSATLPSIESGIGPILVGTKIKWYAMLAYKF